MERCPSLSKQTENWILSQRFKSPAFVRGFLFQFSRLSEQNASVWRPHGGNRLRGQYLIRQAHEIYAVHPFILSEVDPHRPFGIRDWIV